MDIESGHIPPAALSGNPAVFCEYLRQTSQAFLLLGELQDDRVQVRFSGRFEDAAVVWDCEFVTLQSEWRRMRARGGADALRSLIEIGEPSERGVPLRVALDLPRIDRPAILKMMVMIRNYKRLRRGRHAFGAPYHDG